MTKLISAAVLMSVFGAVSADAQQKPYSNPNSMAAIEADVQKIIADLLAYEEQPEEDELGDRLSNHLTKPSAVPQKTTTPATTIKTDREYDQILDQIDVETSKLTALLDQQSSTGSAPASCSLADKKQTDMLDNITKKWSGNQTAVGDFPPATERKRDKVRRKTRETVDRLRQLCGKK